MFAMAKRGRVLTPHGATRFNPIHCADLAEACVETLHSAEAIGREIQADGPDTPTKREIGELTFEALGKAPRITGIPV